MKTFAAFNASNAFQVCKRIFDRYCRGNGFIRGPSGKNRSLKNVTGSSDLNGANPKILDHGRSLVKNDNYR